MLLEGRGDCGTLQGPQVQSTPERKKWFIRLIAWNYIAIFSVEKHDQTRAIAYTKEIQLSEGQIKES